MKRKILIALLVIVAVFASAFGFAACDLGSSNENSNQNGSDTEQDGSSESGSGSGNETEGSGNSEGNGSQGGENSEPSGHKHKYAVDTIASNCLRQGYTLYTCIYCGDFYKTDFTDKSEHNYIDNICYVCNEIDPKAPDTKGLVFSLNSDGQSYTISGKGTVSDTYLKIPATYNGKPVTDIADSSFVGCNSFISMFIPNSITHIVGGAFSGFSSLTNIMVDKENTFFHSDGNCLIDTASKTLLLGCKNSVIPADGSVTAIEERAFEDCYYLTNIIIPDSVKNIESYAFSGCNLLESINIPINVTSIGLEVFEGCDSLVNITVDKDNTTFHSAGNCIIHTESKTLVVGCKNSIIPTDDSVITIGSAAFSGCSLLEKIAIPDGVTSISSSAFSNCSSLMSINIPDSVIEVGAHAFYGCSNLYETENGIEYVDKWVVGYDGSVSSVTLRSDTVGIASNVFYYINSLKSITIPESVRIIGQAAFHSCNSITDILFTGNIEQWKAISKGIFWNDNKSNYIITCADGKLDKGGNIIE